MPLGAVEQFQKVMSPLQTELKYYTWKAVCNRSGVFMSEYVWLNPYSTGNDQMAVFQEWKQTQTYTWPLYSKHTCSQTQSHMLSSHLQPREVMKTNGRVLFPPGPEEELSHQANFILVWPRDSISSGCFYKRRAAPRHRSVMDMRAWWPDGRCWPCNPSSKHSLLTPLTPLCSSQCCCICELWISKHIALACSRSRYVHAHAHSHTVIVSA